MKSLQGCLLIAVPTLVDPNFFRSVILLVQHTDEGALGLILNRPSKTTIREAWEQVHPSPCAHDEPLHLGGPCQGPLMAVHNLPIWSDEQVLGDIHFSASSDQLEHLVAAEDALIKFFIGYAGWGAGQLEQELQVGSWETLQGGAKHIFSADPELWERAHRDVAEARFLSALNIKHRPDDPSMN